MPLVEVGGWLGWKPGQSGAIGPGQAEQNKGHGSRSFVRWGADGDGMTSRARSARSALNYSERGAADGRALQKSSYPRGIIPRKRLPPQAMYLRALRWPLGATPPSALEAHGSGKLRSGYDRER